MIMTVFAGIAEFERDLIRERTGGGREAAENAVFSLDDRENSIPISGNWQASSLRRARR
jgi:hypothetical protein